MRFINCPDRCTSLRFRLESNAYLESIKCTFSTLLYTKGPPGALHRFEFNLASLKMSRIGLSAPNWETALTAAIGARAASQTGDLQSCIQRKSSIAEDP